MAGAGGDQRMSALDQHHRRRLLGAEGTTGMTATACMSALEADGGAGGIRRPGFLSVDVDPIDTHLAGYGIAVPPCDVVYRTALPRCFDLFERLGARATFFV